MSEFTDKIIKDLEEAKKTFPEVAINILGDEKKVKVYESSINEAKYCTRAYYADHKNSFPSQLRYESEHMEYLKDYINNLDEDVKLKEALNMAIDGYLGALNILRYYKIKEELDGEG